MSEAGATEKVTKAKAEVTTVVLSDGRSVGFAGKRKMLKETLVDSSKLVTEGDTITLQSGAVSVRLDFRNGETRTFAVPVELIAKSVGHGMEQKLGDETAGEEDVADMIVCVDDLIDRLGRGEWRTERAAGDGFAGASIVIRAIMEASGKDQDYVKKWLQGKLDAAKAKGEKMSRKELYDAFRKPGSRTGDIIDRLEKERLSATSKVDADSALAELG